MGDVSPKPSPEEYTTALLKGNYCKNRNKNVYPGVLHSVEWADQLGHWCELGQKFTESSSLQLLVKGHWYEMGQKFSAS